MSFLQRLKKCDGTVAGVVGALVPGVGIVMDEYRDSVIALCGDVLARGALLTGNYGCGKTTLARVIALGRYVHLLTPETACFEIERNVDAAGTTISSTSVKWFVEMAVPGLTQDVAHAQLFGFVPNMFANAAQGSLGVFERASRGQMPDTESASHIPPGARATGGVVLLDEIGELDPVIQAKLLAIVAGGEEYRFGGAGDPRYRVTFDGLTLGATWRPLDSLRKDLLSRFQGHVIRVPSLNERQTDLKFLIQDLQDEVRLQHSRLAKAIIEDRFPAANHAALKPPQFNEATAEDIRELERVDWSTNGELRGLTQIVWRSSRTRQTLAEAARLHVASDKGPVSPTRSFVVELFERMLAAPRGNASTPYRDLECNVLEPLRREFATYVDADPVRLKQIADRHGITSDEMSRKLYDMKGARTRDTVAGPRPRGRRTAAKDRS